MNEDEIIEIKQKINTSRVISFDVFDTLLFRAVNTPETVFEILGNYFGIHGFKKMRIDAQNRAGLRVFQEKGWPHADINQIYEELHRSGDPAVDWDQVKKTEIELERDSLHANREMLEIFSYAKVQGKRVIAVTDMYLFAETIRDFLDHAGFHGFDDFYCSADEHLAKFNQTLFQEVLRRESVNPEDMLHIGDNKKDDVDYPSSLGIQTVCCQPSADMDKIKNIPDSDIDKGLYKVLYDQGKGFWYNLGVEAGGPLYTGLSLWVRDKLEKYPGKVFFLSRDGYNLYQIFKAAGYSNVEYLLSSRRALIMPGITELNEEDLAELPPFVLGQTVGEVFDYLCIPREKIEGLDDVGFESFDNAIATREDAENVKKLYLLNRGVILERCAYERKNAERYFRSIGLLDDDAIIFDCGWNGSSQHLMAKLLKAIGYRHSIRFWYFGIINTPRSRRQLRGSQYEAYAFDFYKNYNLQNRVAENPVLYELFFSAPHDSVRFYGNDKAVLESEEEDFYKTELLQGIKDYLSLSCNFAEKYRIEYRPGMAVSHIDRMIQMPTEEEARIIGNLPNPDSFSSNANQIDHIGFLADDELQKEISLSICWYQGIMKRKDVSDKAKKAVMKAFGCEDEEKIEGDIYHLEDMESLHNYERWIANTENFSANKILKYQPFFSVVVPVYNTVSDQLTAAIDSVLTQTYKNYELILVDDHSSWPNVRDVLENYENKERVHVIYRRENGNISVATNDGLDAAKGEFVAFMDCDDTLAPNALYEVAAKLDENPELDFIYSDEDKLTEDGKIRHMPFFKPEWSPDLFMTMMYTNHLGVYRTSIVKEIGGLRTAYNGSQDYDMTLRFLEKTNDRRIGHIAKILYHWRERKESVAYNITSKNYASDAARSAKEDYLRRNHIDAELEFIDEMSQYYPVYQVTGNPLVSIIIPSKDHPDVLKRCLESIYRYTAYRNFEIIVVDNGSSSRNRKKIETLRLKYSFRYLYKKMVFNFSQMCNFGVSESSGEYLLFLNDDVEIINDAWLARMLGQAQLAHTGAVGIKLFYPESTLIQHDGISNCTMFGPIHNFTGKDDSCTYYFGWNRTVNDCIAVTGACLLLKKDKFDSVGGYDENLPVAFNDVDLCFKLYEHGFYNVIRNDVAAYHWESLSRGIDAQDNSKYLRLVHDRMLLYQKHPDLKNRDPFFSPNMLRFSPILAVQNNYDTATPVRQLPTETGSLQGDIDLIERNPVIADELNPNLVRIGGWAYLPEIESNDTLEVRIVFRGPNREITSCPTHKSRRTDICRKFDSKRAFLFCGFECVVRKEQIRADWIPYEVGIYARTEGGEEYFRWLGKTTEVFFPYQYHLLPDIFSAVPAGQYEETPSAEKVRWEISEINNKDGVISIKGWAFYDDKTHYLYETSVMLKDEDGRLFRLKTLRNCRIDTAKRFSDRHYLMFTGFETSAPAFLFADGHRYEVVLELKNVMENKKRILRSTNNYVKV